MNGFSWSSASASDAGHVRELNEDACFDEPVVGLWAVADGMGGHDAGDFASRAVVEALQKVHSSDELDNVVSEVERRLDEANADLQAMAARRTTDVIGSTVAVLAVAHDEVACLWAGDSRVYRRRQSQLERLSSDHSEVEQLIADGRLSEEDADEHPDSNIITRAVGAGESLELDSAYFSLRDRDRFLLCTDGLYRELTTEQLSSCLASGNAARACGALMETALQGECKDNLSAVVVEFEQEVP